MNGHTIQQALHKVTYNLNMANRKRISDLLKRSPVAIHFYVWTYGRFRLLGWSDSAIATEVAK
ncbi:hypothetical protein [Scytonema sp. PCC 10023]|uniref:hypothetical protein n=1 Tax=Scytonema sp. PCC 10023 TaxID=1680591 RepID=UPI0039C69DCE